MIGAKSDLADYPETDIERGVTCARQAHYAEAASYFARACEGPIALPLATACKAFVDSHARYWIAEQELHDATRRFVVADADQQAQLADVQLLLSQVPQVSDRPAPERPQTDRLSHSDNHDRHDRSSALDGELPALSIICFGRFEVWRAGKQVELCGNRHGQMILRYLATRPHHRETIDTLLDILWPDDSENSRRKLYVALSALRRAMNHGYDCQQGAGYVLSDNGMYQLNPAIPIHTDAAEFVALYHSGQEARGDQAIPFYEDACRLYSSPFLPDDLYADWSLIQREQLTQIHLTMCHALAIHYAAMGRHSEAATWLLTILDEDRCDEDAYQQLMRAYILAGRRSEALRQYQRCEQVLREEMGVAPMPATTELFYAILRGESVPSLAGPTM